MAYIAEIQRREEIIEAHRQGMEISEISRKCQVGERTAYRLIRQERETGDISPKKIRGRKPSLSEADTEEIRELILRKPYITIAEIKEELGLTISISGIHRVITENLGFQRLYVPINQTQGLPAAHSGGKNVISGDVAPSKAAAKVKPVKRGMSVSKPVKMAARSGGNPVNAPQTAPSPGSAKDKRKTVMR